MSAIILRFPCSPARTAACGQSLPRPTRPLPCSSPLDILMDDIARLAALETTRGIPWWDDFSDRPSGLTGAGVGAVLLPCSLCGVPGWTRCECRPQCAGRRRRATWKRLSTLERAIVAALAELRADVGPNVAASVRMEVRR